MPSFWCFNWTEFVNFDKPGLVGIPITNLSLWVHRQSGEATHLDIYQF